MNIYIYVYIYILLSLFFVSVSLSMKKHGQYILYKLIFLVRGQRVAKRKNCILLQTSFYRVNIEGLPPTDVHIEDYFFLLFCRHEEEIKTLLPSLSNNCSLHFVSLYYYLFFLAFATEQLLTLFPLLSNNCSLYFCKDVPHKCTQISLFNRVVQIWNDVPHDIIVVEKLSIFKRRIYEFDVKKYCIGRAFTQPI